MQRTQLAIIGGGLVGASLALALQEGAKARGWKITLIEPFAPGDSYQPSYDARSSALSFGTRQIYERLGLWQAIARRAEPILQIHVSDRGRFGAARLAAIEEGVPALGYVVENAWLGQCLWQALDAEVVSWHCPPKWCAWSPWRTAIASASTMKPSSTATWRYWPTAAAPACASNWASASSATPMGRLR